MMENGQSNGYRHILKYTSIFGSVQGLNVLAALVRNKVAAVFLGPAGMGLASILTTTMNFLTQIAGMGLSVSAVRHVSEYFEEGDLKKILHFVCVIRLWCMFAALFGLLLSVFVGYWTLAPAVVITIIGGGEMAILKGARQLHSLAAVQSIAAIASVLICVPLYWMYGQDAIVVVINLMAFAAMLPAVFAAYRLYSPRLVCSSSVIGEGIGMMRLGIAYSLAAMVGSGAELLIRWWLERESGLSEVGLYNAGSLLTVTYMGLVFAAMDNDYFPRLSAFQEVGKTNEVVNRQMEVLLWLVSPLLVVMILCLPWIIRLLLSSDFLPVVTMAQIAAVAMVLKAATLPVGYITLARGRSLAYLCLESAYFLVFVPLVMAGYRQWGLLGTGIAILLAHVFDFVMIHLYAYKTFGYRLNARNLYIIIAALAIVSAALWLSLSLFS
ncbi:MAG: oligosaccharide flippase family protein [Prevotella sp.]|nr:oligosaccharide flippase family protein [Prevotella sp.]